MPEEKIFGVMSPPVLQVEQERYIHMVLKHSDAVSISEDREKIQKTLYISPEQSRRMKKFSEIEFMPCECEEREFGYRKDIPNSIKEKLKLWGTNEFKKSSA